MITDKSRVLQTLERIHNGPVADTFTWDATIIPRAIRKILKQYRLEKTCDPNNPVNTNDDLSDKFFQAGLD